MTDNHDQQIDGAAVVQAYLSGNEPEPDLRLAVQSMGAAADESNEPMLRRVAEVSSATGNRKVTFDALDALSKSSPDRSFLIEAARNHGQNKWLAYHAIIVLGREPGDDEVRELLSTVKAEASDPHILSAIAMAERVEFLEQAYTALPSTEGRIQLVLDSLRTEWNPITGDGGDIDLGTDPQAAWGQQKISELSGIDPKATAEALARLQPRGAAGQVATPYKQFLSKFLTEESRAHFDELIGEDRP